MKKKILGAVMAFGLITSASAGVYGIKEAKAYDYIYDSNANKCTLLPKDVKMGMQGWTMSNVTEMTAAATGSGYTFVLVKNHAICQALVSYYSKRR